MGYKTNSDIRDSRDQMGAGFNRVMDQMCIRDRVTPNETTVGIAATKTNIEDGTTVQNPITLPSSTSEKAGVQSPMDS